MLATAEQQAILDNVQNSLRILAAAGSGKTTTMAQKVKDEISSGRCKAEEICFTTFTRFAADQIRSRVKRVIGYEVNILCGTFHSIIHKLRIRALLPSKKPDDLYSARMEEWVKEFMGFLIQGHPGLIKIIRTFKVLIVDEFQDLDEAQFEFVSLFKQIQPSLRVLAIGDLAQNIYRFRGTSNEFLRTRLQKEVCVDLNTYELTTNFRSTKAILNVVNALFSEEIQNNMILPMVAGPNALQGKKPSYYEFAINPGKGVGEYEELVVDTLYPILVAAKIEKKSVVLIFPIVKCQSCELIMALLKQLSKKNGFKLDLHKIAKEDETCSTVSFSYDTHDPKSPIQFSSIHSSKGLEWDIVALIDMSDYIYDLRGSEDCEAFYAEKTNLTYVAVTRAAEELYIFANANGGGRHRKLAALGNNIHDIFDVIPWGTHAKDYEAALRKPIAVTDLIRKLPQHEDLFKRIRECSKHILPIGIDGFPMLREDVYEEMKMRNRELAFGTFIDWKLKQILCGPQTLQDIILELMSCYNRKHFYKSDAHEELSFRLAKLDVYFMNADKTPKGPLEQYVAASRYMGLHSARYYGFTDSVRQIYRDVEQTILKAAAASQPTLKEEYILSQLRSFYTRGSTSEITAFDAPTDTYMGMPEDLDLFIIQNIERSAQTLSACLRDTGACQKLRGDVCLESISLIMGEADIISDNGVLLEMKCGKATKAAELRDSMGNSKHILQVLAYIALARHGTIPVELHRACIVNPLTGAWERYELSIWTEEQSMEFMSCLEELRERP
jgi:hypothetical protein